MNLEFLAPQAKRTSELLTAVATARGCNTPDEIAEFLAPLPPISNPFADLISDYPAARDRLARAIARREVIVVFGDFDADGITSMAQMVRFLRVAGANMRWFIPHRITDEYGLTFAAVARCVAIHHPQLILTVDCGSNSADQMAWLKKQGIDAIVLDHHTMVVSSPGAVAHLNPKAFCPDHELASMSASGLVYLFTELLARDLGLEPQWQRIKEGNLIMAGLGTVTDVVPMRGINRAIVKHAVSLAAQPDILIKTPGLAALSEKATTKEVTFSTFGFEWGPRINACGRMDDASAAIELLLSVTIEDARDQATKCEESNSRRIAVQRQVTQAAIAAGEEQLSKDNQTKVLVVAGYDWHPGVMSIVAARLKEYFNRPVVALAWVEEGESADQGAWKGSGRSFESFNMGAAFHTAVEQGIIVSGGGHPNSAGVRLLADRLDDFRAFLQSVCSAPVSGFSPTYEVLGHVEDLPPEVWHKVLSRLEPFGAGNPRPYLSVRGTKLMQPPVEKRSAKDRSHIFALSGLFQRTKSTEEPLIRVDWFDPNRAAHTWSVDRQYDLVLQLNRRPPTPPYSTPLFSWRVTDCCPSTAIPQA